MPPTAPPPDTPVRRRTVLTVGALAATAGCLGRTETDDTPTEAIDEDERFTDPDVYTLRFETDEHVLYDTDDEPASRQYIIDTDDIEEFVIEGEPIEGSVAELEAFLEELDYQEQSAVLTEHVVGGCERTNVLYVKRRDGGGLRLRSCHTHRDPDVECSKQEEHQQLTAVSAPVSFETQPPGFGSGARHDCSIREPDNADNDEPDNGGETDDGSA